MLTEYGGGSGMFFCISPAPTLSTEAPRKSAMRVIGLFERRQEAAANPCIIQRETRLYLGSGGKSSDPSLLCAPHVISQHRTVVLKCQLLFNQEIAAGEISPN